VPNEFDKIPTLKITEPMRGAGDGHCHYVHIKCVIKRLDRVHKYTIALPA